MECGILQGPIYSNLTPTYVADYLEFLFKKLSPLLCYMSSIYESIDWLINILWKM